jgi:predicted SPOUT superfamily RNA methylase MTH1
MKKAFLSLLGVLLVARVLAQVPVFEGRILYKNTFTLPNGQDVTLAVGQTLGDEQDYYINARHYKSLMNGYVVRMQLYRSDENAYYSVDGKQNAQRYDGSIPTSKVVSIEKLPGEFVVLGRPCKGLVMTTTSGKTTYYYDETLRVNVQSFTQHKIGNWDEYLAASGGCLPLSFTIETPQYTWKSEAVKVKAMKLDDAFFALPDGVTVKR